MNLSKIVAVTDQIARLLTTEEAAPEVEVKHPKILQVKEGEFTKTGAEHFIKRAESAGHADITHALENLVRWNEGKGGEHDKIAAHAKKMVDAVRAHFTAKEAAKKG